MRYFIYFCELKNPLPAMWAKDYLKQADKNNIAKGIGQIQKIIVFQNKFKSSLQYKLWIEEFLHKYKDDKILI